MTIFFSEMIMLFFLKVGENILIARIKRLTFFPPSKIWLQKRTILFHFFSPVTVFLLLLLTTFQVSFSLSSFTLKDSEFKFCWRFLLLQSKHRELWPKHIFKVSVLAQTLASFRTKVFYEHESNEQHNKSTCLWKYPSNAFWMEKEYLVSHF